MKNQKTVFYTIAIALVSIVFGEWYVLTNYTEMPNWIILQYLKLGFFFRVITFVSLPFLLYNQQESLVEKYYKKGKASSKKPHTFTFQQKQWIIFSYLAISFIAIFSLNFLTISVFIPGILYAISGSIALCFSFFRERPNSDIQTDDAIIFSQYSINIKGKSNDGSKEKWLNIVNTFRGIFGFLVRFSTIIYYI